jgi:hypothetical protein
MYNHMSVNGQTIATAKARRPEGEIESETHLTICEALAALLDLGDPVALPEQIIQPRQQLAPS